MPVRTPLLKDLLYIAHPLGRFVLGFAVAFALPAALALLNQDGQALNFGCGAAAAVLIGLPLRVLGARWRGALRARDAYLLVALVWLVLGLIAAIPLWLGVPQLSYTDAFFETTAGLTTTAATVLTGLDALPDSIKLWRAELQWLGGLGMLALGMAVLPLLGIGGMQLYRSDTGGPIKDSRMGPRLRQTAGSLWLVYLGLTLLCGLALKLAGMSSFDALCHALSTVSLGGFSTHDASIGWFHSAAVEAVLAVFMLLSALNYASHYAALRGRSLRPYFTDAEAWTVLKTVLVSAVAVGGYLWWQGVYARLPDALRYGGFNVLSLATGTGYISTDYDGWPLAVPLWMLLLSCICACTGSPGGGIRMIRTLILFRQSGRDFGTLLHPSAVQIVKIGGRVIPDDIVSSVLGFIHLYTLSVLGLSFVMILSGADFLTGFSAIIATINNVGPGLRGVGPGDSYTLLSDFQTWVCTISMLLGRLEIFVLIVPFTRAYWRD